MKNQNRREFIKITGKTLLVTSGISVFGLSSFPANASDEVGAINDAFFSDGYYDDGYYNDGYYNDGYYNDGYSTGINSYHPDLLPMTVLPNPSMGNFELQLTSRIEGIAEIFITDLVGRTMKRESRELVQGPNHLHFKAEELARGIYYLSVITSKGTGSVRLVIAK